MIIPRLDKYRIILASRSPRRQQLLRDLGISFDVAEVDFDESFPEALTGRETALYLAARKADVFRNSISADEIVITADTIVWCNGKILGKPLNYDQAMEMILDLSGNTHDVITGVNILGFNKELLFEETTRVTFAKLSAEEIDYYIKNFSPYDKAGAYGIQEWIGIAACSRIEGSYFNVVGLPVQRLYRELIDFVTEPD